MHIPRLYIDQQLKLERSIVLPEKASHHILHVLRSKAGSPLIIFNGLGGEYHATISKITRRDVELSINSFDDIDRESGLNITLAIGILKRDAMNASIQKAVELGVRHIVPIESTNTAVSRKQYEKRTINWLQIIQSACEQSGRTALPSLSASRQFDEWLVQENFDGQLTLFPSRLSKTLLRDISVTPKSICLIVGPEGGMTIEEEALASEQGFTSVSFGRRILRAETAPAALLALMQYRWGDL